MTPNPYQIKADITNELRNVLYYNRLEIERFLSNQANKSHKETIDTVIYLLKLNVEAENSIELLERYLPTQNQPSNVPPPAPVDVPSESSDGIKKVD